MLKNDVAVEDDAAPANTPDVLSKVKKEDVKQAIAEPFKGNPDSPAPRSKKRSPYWQPADDQC